MLWCMPLFIIRTLVANCEGCGPNLRQHRPCDNTAHCDKIASYFGRFCRNLRGCRKRGSQPPRFATTAQVKETSGISSARGTPYASSSRAKYAWSQASANENRMTRIGVFARVILDSRLRSLSSRSSVGTPPVIWGLVYFSLPSNSPKTRDPSGNSQAKSTRYPFASSSGSVTSYCSVGETNPHEMIDARTFDSPPFSALPSAKAIIDRTRSIPFLLPHDATTLRAKRSLPIPLPLRAESAIASAAGNGSMRRQSYTVREKDVTVMSLRVTGVS